MSKLVKIFNENIGTHLMCLHQQLEDGTHSVMHLDLAGQIHNQGYDNWDMYIKDAENVHSKNQTVFTLAMYPFESNLVLRHDSDPTNPNGSLRAWAADTKFAAPVPLTYNEDAATITTVSGSKSLYLSSNLSDPRDSYVYFTEKSTDRWKIEYIR